MVNSVSYGYLEYEMPASYLDSFESEMIALSARGVTLMASSGDDGAVNFQCQCDQESGSSTLAHVPANNVSYSGVGYSPSWPASSPYVTAVGATQGPEKNQPAIACSSTTGGLITTGGGFSTFYAAPSWQTNAITSYFAQAATDGTTPTPGYDPQVCMRQNIKTLIQLLFEYIRIRCLPPFVTFKT
jgi:tripeptidyl-peptidase I